MILRYYHQQNRKLSLNSCNHNDNRNRKLRKKRLIYNLNTRHRFRLQKNLSCPINCNQINRN